MIKTALYTIQGGFPLAKAEKMCYNSVGAFCERPRANTVRPYYIMR